MLVLISISAQAAHQVKFLAEVPVDSPVRVAPDKNGTMYVTTKDGVILVYTGDGRQLLKIPGNGPDGEKLLKKPTGIAVYDSKIYVCDRSRDKVFIFAANGTYLDSFGEGGSGAKQFSNPEGITINQGVIYVADYGNDRIQAFSINGVHLQTIGADGEDDKRLKSPTDVAVDYRGNIYAIDGDSRMIKIYRQDGVYTGKITGPVKPYSLAMAADGLFVTDSENYNITKYSFKGHKQFSFGTLGAGRVQFKEILGIAADSAGKVYAIDGDKNSVQIIATDKSDENELPFNVAPPTTVLWKKDIRQTVKKICWDKINSRLYAIDPENSTVLVLRNGTVEKRISLKDRNPVAVAVDPQGMPWVLDREEQQLLKLDQNGAITLKIGESGSRDGYFSKANDLSISKDGLVYVADTNNDRVQVFNGDGVFLNAIGKGVIEEPIAIDLDGNGNLYVLQASRKSIYVFTASGLIINEFGNTPTAGSRLENPVSLAVTGKELLVLDAGSNSVKVFGLNGKFKREFGAKGEGKGDFRKPASIAVMDEGKFLIADYGNGRIQEFATIYTPMPPEKLMANAGMRSVMLSWKAAEDIPIDSFRVFRRQERDVSYTEVATTKSKSFFDTSVLPDIKYYYRVSSRVKDGNESISLSNASATPSKYTPPPPANLEAKSLEWSVDLFWQATDKSHVDYYAVYRDSDVKDAPPLLLGKTREYAFSDAGLDSDTPYRYLVSTVSIDGIESEPAVITIKTMIATRPPLELDIIELQDIFSNTYKIYENEGIGKVRLTNNTRDEIVTLKLAFHIKEFMDFPTEIELKHVPPGKSQDITLKAVFNNKILDVTEDTPVQTELKASYFQNQTQRSFSKNNTVNLYEKHRMMWVNKDRVATFVTSKDPVALEFTRSIVTQYAEKGSPLVFAAAIYDYLGFMGMTYLQHPNNPYQIVEGKTKFVDYVQYPRETLKRNSGVCTDLVVLFAAVLEGLGIRTKLLGTPDHLFIMFAVGQVSELGDSTMNGMFVIHEGSVWAPVELTLVGSPFMKAWEAGSKGYSEWKGKGLEITDLGKAWERYKPATLPVTEWRAQIAKRSDVDKRYNNEIAKLNRIMLKYTSNRYFDQINSNPSNGNAYLQLGIIYGESGELAEAKTFLDKALILLPDNPEVINNIANIYYLSGNYKTAAQKYERAAALDPADPYILVNLSLCYVKLDNKAKATQTFRKAITIDPELLKKYRTISIELLGSM